MNKRNGRHKNITSTLIIRKRQSSTFVPLFSGARKLRRILQRDGACMERLASSKHLASSPLESYIGRVFFYVPVAPAPSKEPAKSNVQWDGELKRNEPRNRTRGRGRGEKGKTTLQRSIGHDLDFQC